MLNSLKGSTTEAAPQKCTRTRLLMRLSFTRGAVEQTNFGRTIQAILNILHYDLIHIQPTTHRRANKISDLLQDSRKQKPNDAAKTKIANSQSDRILFGEDKQFTNAEKHCNNSETRDV